MAENHDYIALDWVRGEIEQTLSQARTALETFVENKDDTTQITFCLNYIHQVHGTLQMVEFYGAALLAEEMEKLCQAILNDDVSVLNEALEVLMESLLQLESYLDHIQSGQRDLPVVLLPILNDLRALQGQPLLSDTSLFTPNLSAAQVLAQPEHNARLSDEKVLANLRKLRQMFQFSLAGIIRNQDLAANFGNLYRVLARLEKFCSGTPLGKIWWVAVGYLDAIQDVSVGLSSAPKQLLRELDHQIKLMLDEHESILSRPLPEDLLKNLLYYVAKTQSSSRRIDELKDAFDLAAALPSAEEVDQEREKMQGPGQETMASVVSVLNEELAQVKDQLDLYVRSPDKDNQGLLNMVPALNQVANTMAVLGLGVARRHILDQVTKIESIANSDEPANDQDLMDMAGALLYVEANLATLTDSSQEENDLQEEEFVVPVEQFEDAHNAVITESRNGLEQAKNSIVSFIASQWDHAEIADVPSLLDSIRGGLQIIPLPRAATLLEACSHYIQEEILSSKAVPDWEQLDRLADAITSIEYYMERLSEGAKDNDRVLQIAEESISKLGFGSQETSNETPQAMLSEHHIAEVASESPNAVVKESDEDLIDEEILEIFIEEAAEVMVDINVAMTALKTNAEDLDALKELRRAFHTLKGSGRLVGASAIGELAWSVENLLNKYLEKDQALSFEIFDFLDSIIEQLPVLTDDFANQRESENYSGSIARAEMLLNQFLAGSNEEMLVPSGSSQTEPDHLQTTDHESKSNIERVHTEIESQDEPSTTDKQTSDPSIEADEDDDLIDDEILEIFIEEAGEVLETISNYLPTFLAEFDNNEALTELRRAFHTLKGSGRMVGAEAIGETAWGIENLLNRVIDGSILMNQDIADVVKFVADLIPELVEHFKHNTKPTTNLAAIQQRCEALAKGEFLPSLDPAALKTDSDETRTADETKEAEALEYSLGVDAALLEIFESEASGHVDSVLAFANGIDDDLTSPINDTLSRALHTLKGSANTANIQPIAEIAVPVEKFIKEARAHGIEVDKFIADMLTEAMGLVNQGMARVHSAPQDPIEGSESFLSSLKDLHQSMLDKASADENDWLKDSSPDPQLISIFLTEGLDILLDAEKILNDWSENPISGEPLKQLISEVKTLNKGAQVAGLDSISELCDCLEACYAAVDVVPATPDSTFLTDIKRGHDALIDMMDQVAAGLTAVPDNKLLAQLREHALEQQSDASLEFDLNEKLDELDGEITETLSAASLDETEPASDIAENSSILDPDLAEIFLEEAREVIQSIKPALEQLEQNSNIEAVLIQLQRDLHTLKGGARLAELTSMGDLAHSLESVFDRLVEQNQAPHPELFNLLEDSEKRLSEMLNAIEQHEAAQSADDLIEQLSHALSVQSASAQNTDSPETDENELAPASLEATTETVEHEEVAPEPVASEELIDLDPELVEIFLEEARDIIDNSGSLLHQWESDTQNIELVGELQRELHTLKGGARMAEINSIGDIAHELETLFERIVEQRFEASGDMVPLCLACHDALANMVESVSAGNAIQPAQQLLSQIKQVVETGNVEQGSDDVQSVVEDEIALSDVQIPEVQVEEALPAETADIQEATFDTEALDDDLTHIFIDESRDILSASSEYIDRWNEDEEGLDGVVELQREMHTLKGGARLADVDAIADIAGAIETRIGKLLDGLLPHTNALRAVVTKSQQHLSKMLDQLISGETVSPLPALVAEIDTAGEANESTASETKSTQATSTTVPDWLASLGEDVDEEVIEMFVEEAGELIEALEEQIANWSKSPESEEPNREIQRILHTLKGGARLSSLNKLADESHDLETRLIEALDKGQAFDGDFKQTVLNTQDVLLKLVDDLQKLAESHAAGVSKAPADSQETSPQSSEVEKVRAESTPAPQAPPVQKKAETPAPKTTEEKPSPVQKAAKAASQETIRVSAGLLEELVNLAGETSISRGRLEQQISDFGFTLEEMSATIERLREQLRRLEMETEAQVLFTAEKEGLAVNSEYEEFDPLEMDRYSSIQQLSRALTESTTDLLELRETLADRSRDAETILLQQSRITSELQEGLMKTRMIPFSSMVPRLRRIVRQISGELNKQVAFDVSNAEGEMDRSVLERMIAPLEHMLRNALDHGIESAQDRKKAGKNEKGTITLSLSREGGDIVLRMQDDGAGINDEVVLNKAIKQGLVSKDAKPNRHEILQFIMLPGFSTAEQITQISGRGVGMDVVANEIKQMGGNLDIESTLGAGTEFTVRLPFTVSVNRALMVNTGEDFYAIPLNTIEGIVRVSPYELEEYYKPDAPLYEYAGRKYQLKYLGKLLHSNHQPKLQGQPLPLPVILVRGTDQPMALQVDSLMGSREIVVKGLGPQFAGVNGVSGATILGDGSVVVILDLPALIRDDIAGLLDIESAQEAPAIEDQRAKLVMVVDDSVTVRKVTTRLLERNGMDVITAKDGVDAIAQLQDHKPDVMLLDIEMPRMDGFEVATLVRHDERLKDVPIIMITSRTGQKHRERALGIGVNEYLGKPFQEKDLLENIERLTSGSD